MYFKEFEDWFVKQPFYQKARYIHGERIFIKDSSGYQIFPVQMCYLTWIDGLSIVESEGVIDILTKFGTAMKHAFISVSLKKGDVQTYSGVDLGQACDLEHVAPSTPIPEFTPPRPRPTTKVNRCCGGYQPVRSSAENLIDRKCAPPKKP